VQRHEDDHRHRAGQQHGDADAADEPAHQPK
jgi:hypothetical protein